MINPITVTASAGRLRLTHEIHPGTRPVDIDQVNTDLTEILTQFSANVQRAKLVHDLKILQAALLALVTHRRLEDAKVAIENVPSTAAGASNLVTAYLRSHGWAPAGDTLDLANGDVIVNTTDGYVLVNVRDLETGEDHLETTTGDHWSAAPGNWWKIGNVLTVTNATGQDFEDVQRSLEIPQIPGLTTVLDQLTVGTR